MKPLIVVAGVSGSGKSTIGIELAGRLGIPFIDGDELHPDSNVQKMANGIPLDDEDRWPWLWRVGNSLREAEGTGLVIACSALTRSYRQIILDEESRTRFVMLEGSPELLASRLKKRQGHFMPPTLLGSQFETLEELAPTEPGFTVSVTDSPTEIVDEIIERLQAM